MLLVFLSLVEYAIILRRIVIHQRSLEKWRQEQLKDVKPEASAEVSLFVPLRNMFTFSNPQIAWSAFLLSAGKCLV